MFDSMTPPISYYGGKQRMAHKIVPLIPQHTVYAEPFCGGATILFKKPWPQVTNNDHYREAINDLDGNLINFYKQLQTNGDELCRLIELTPYSEQLYRESLRENLHDGADLERAVKYYINITQSFSNKLNGGWGVIRYGRNPVAVWTSKSHSLFNYIKRMAEVHIANTDALTFIKQWDSPQTFFYCDPPYPRTNQGHYSGYAVSDFQNLIDTLESCKGSFILSNYDQLDVKIPSHWERFEFEARSSAAKSVKGKTNYDTNRVEVVWRRFNNEPVRAEIQALYDSGKFDCYVKNPYGDL